MKTHTFLGVLVSRPHVNGVFGHLKRRRENAHQREAIPKRRLTVFESKTKTETSENDVRQAVAFLNR